MLGIGLDDSVPSKAREKHSPFPWRSRRLLDSARGGSWEAFEELVHPLQIPLKRYLIRQLGEQEAADALQDVVISAWKGMGRFEPRASFKTWVFAIAEYKVLSIKSRKNRSREGPPASEEPESTQAQSAYHQAELRTILELALREIPSEQVEVLILYFEQEQTLDEISRRVGRNLNTIKSQFYAGRKKLLEQLELTSLEILKK